MDASPQIYWAHGGGDRGRQRGHRLNKALLEVLRFPVVFWMVNVEVRKHPRSGAARHCHLRPAVETGAKTGAAVTNPEGKYSSFSFEIYEVHRVKCFHTGLRLALFRGLLLTRRLLLLLLHPAHV